ncbi:MAG: prolyl oligopeptidase family serine peptidase, partial [Parachlamydiaceae bacterium]|nr:prolyl oligopeptidase family serine peptidase [Parachlamydiaceae bacterium]
IQGANDPRVLQVESDQIVEAVTKNNVPCKYLLFEDEGHGFVKKKNRLVAAESILDFLNEHLPIGNEQ